MPKSHHVKTGLGFTRINSGPCNPPARSAVISDAAINRLSAVQLRALADDFARQAESLRLRAARAEAREKNEALARQRADRLSKAADMAADAGGSRYAVKRAATAYHVPPEAVTALLDHASRSREDINRGRRNILIMRLAEKGWSNIRIAARFQISDSQVSRIIRRAMGGG